MKTPITSSTSIPLVGFGTYKIDDETAERSVGHALTTGYRHIDTAEGYRNETGVGRALAHSGLDREEIFVTTKLWPGNPAWGEEPKSYRDTLRGIDQSLNRLGLEHVDLYLIHAPCGGEQRLQQWEALLEAQSRGRARSVGVSNFSICHLEKIQAAGLPKPEANQIELHPWSQKPILTDYLKDNSIATIAYSSLVPLEGWRVSSGLEDNTKSKRMIRDGRPTHSLFAQMAARYQVSEAQILLRWGIQKGYPVLPKSTHPDRIAQNFDLFSFTISDTDMESIAAMDRGSGVAWAEGDPTVIFQ